MKMGYKRLLLITFTGAVMFLGLPYRLAFAPPTISPRTAVTVVSCSDLGNNIQVTYRRTVIVLSSTTFTRNFYDTCNSSGQRVEYICDLLKKPGYRTSTTSCPSGQVCQSGACVLRCGNGTLQSGEACDDGDANNNTTYNACRTDCTGRVPAVCGNGVTEGTEACDDGAANNDTTDGACRTNCSGRVAACGNGRVDPTEQCDGPYRLGQHCYNLGYDSGLLGCNSACRFDFDMCATVEDGYGATPDETLVSEDVCGNFMIEDGEVCDRANMGLTPPTCSSYGYAGGSASMCRDDCLGVTTRYCYGNTGNPTATTPPAGDTNYEEECGNYFPDDGEHCEHAYYSGSGGDPSRIFVESDVGYTIETCAGRGYTGGTIRCIENCERVDTSGCYGDPGAPYGTVSDPPDDPDYVGRCFNRFWDEGEECEMAQTEMIVIPDDLDARCSDVGFDGGSLRCLTCILNTDRCYGGTEGDRLGQHCGDGVIQSEDGEECDGTNLGGATCSSRGFDAGTLRCVSYECSFDQYSCWDSPASYGTP